MAGSTEDAAQEVSANGTSSGSSEEEGSEPEDLAFPASYAGAVNQLLQSSKLHPVAVRDVALESKEEKVGLVLTLWSEGYLCTSGVRRRRELHKSKAKRQRR